MERRDRTKNRIFVRNDIKYSIRRRKEVKKIAIFTGYYLPHIGGVERYTYHLAREFSRHGHKVYIITCRYDRTLPEIEETKEATIYRLPTYSLFVNRHPILKFNRRQRELIKKLEEEKIDNCIFQTRFWQTTLQGGFFARKNKIPSILIEHGTSHLTQDNKLIEVAGAWYEHFLTNIVKEFHTNFYGVSNSCVKWLEHFHIKGKGVFYNSIDITEYEIYNNSQYSLPIKKETLKIAFVGRIIQNKGINELVEAYRTLEKRYPIALVIAGEGPVLEKLKKENEDIIFTGSLNHDEVMRLYASSDIFVNPSYSEGLPTTVLEAGLMKCAVVATNVGGTPEIIEDGKEGLLCKPEVLDITEKLEVLIKDETLRSKFAENLHKKVMNQFSWDKTAKDILEVMK